MGAGWRLLEDGPAEAAWNMALDEAVAGAVGAGRTDPTLRLYGWTRPSVSLGYAEAAAGAVDLEACRRLGIPLVRRITGGRAVLHGPGELTYSLSLPLAGIWARLSVTEAFGLLGQGLLGMLARLGIRATLGSVDRGAGVPAGPCFLARRVPAVLVGGRKLIGSAQRRGEGWVLQHGSLLVEYDEAEHAAVFPGWPRGESAKVTSLVQLLGRRPSPAELGAAFRAAWEECWGARCRAEAPSPGERAEAARLVEDRYGAAAWTFRR